MVKISPSRLLETNLVVCYLIAYFICIGDNVSTANVFEAKTSFSELIRHALNVPMFDLLNSAVRFVSRSRRVSSPMGDNVNVMKAQIFDIHFNP